MSFSDEEHAELIAALSRTADIVAGLLDTLDILRVALESRPPADRGRSGAAARAFGAVAPATGEAAITARELDDRAADEGAVTRWAHRWPARLNEAGRSAKVSALISALTIAGVALAAEGQTRVSWVPYQIGCPVLLLDLKTDTNVHAAVFGSIDVQNISSDPVEEITVGALAGPYVGETPRRLVALQTVTTSIAPGERRRISLQLHVRDAVPTTARHDAFLITLGVVQVRDRGGSVWVSPVTIAGEFTAVNWPSTPQAQARHACLDGRRRLYPPGAVLFDERHAAHICQADGTWAPR